MARLYTCGFELNQASHLGAATEYNSLSSGAVGASSTVKRTGTYGLVASGSSGFMTHLYQAEGTSNNHYFRFYLYIDSSVGADATAIALFRSTTSGNLCSIRLNTNNTLELWNEQTAAQLGSDSSALSADTWYRIELEYRRSASSAHAYIDGSQFATGTIANDLTTSSIRLGLIDDSTGTLYFDDVAVNDSTGTAQTGLPGAGSIVHAHPTGAGDNAATAGTSAEIDEVAPDDSATDRIQLDDTTTIADYAMTDSATLGIGSSDTISLVEVGVRIKEETSTTTSYNLRIKSASGGTTTSSGATDAGNTTYRTNPTGTTAFSHRLVSYLDPTTGVAWTPTGTNSIDSMQVGVRSNDADDIWVSTLWATIEYVPSAGGGASVTPSTLALTTATFAPTVTASDHKIVTPSTLALTTATFAPSISISNNQLATPDTASLTLSTFAPTVALSDNQLVTPTTASLSLATFAPTVSVSDNQSITPGTASLAISTFAPTVTTTASITVTPDTLSLTLNTFEPSIVVGIRVTPDVAALTLTSFAPTVSVSDNQSVTPSTLALTLSTFAPVIAVSDNKSVTPITASLTISTFAPSVVLGTVVTPDTAVLTLATFEPTVSIVSGVTVTPDPATLTLATFAPTISVGGNVTVTPSTLSLVLATFAPNVHTGFPVGDSVGSATWTSGGVASGTVTPGDGTGSATWIPGDQV